MKKRNFKIILKLNKMNQEEAYKFFNVCGGYICDNTPRQQQSHQNDKVNKVKVDFIDKAQLMSYSKSLKNN